MASKLPQGKGYLVSHSGQTAIICGSAPCLFKEFEEAKTNMPDAKVFVVNESSWAVWGDFLVSYHAEKFNKLKTKSLNPDIITLTAKGYRDPEEECQVDYRFTDITIGATSVGDAAQIATSMGFDSIVIVGAPMNGCDGYYNDTKYFDKDTHTYRFGSPEQGESTQVALNKSKLASISGDLTKVRSMSGYSKKILGGVLW